MTLQAERGLEQKQQQHQKQVPERRVPAARIDFTKEDRVWIADRIQQVLETGQLTLGRYGAEFETRFAEFCGVRHAVAVSSGTAALEIILRSLDVTGKKVLVPANTFFATAAAVIHAGATPVFLEMDAETMSVRPEDVDAAITDDTAGLIVVHIGGVITGRIEELRELATRRGIWMVEDAAHAHGSRFKEAHAGTFGVAGAFSFYPTKVMTSGEGGMIVTNDDRIAEEARIYRDQGKASFLVNAHVRLGYNWRMSEPHAIIGLRHLERLPEMVEERRQIARIYDRELAVSNKVQSLAVPPGSLPNYYKYICLLKEKVDRAQLKARLRDEWGVSLSGEVYESPLHRQPVFENYATGSLPLAEDICARHICLPIFSGMTEDDAKQVIDAIEAVL